jgi:hypothetical protein
MQNIKNEDSVQNSEDANRTISEYEYDLKTLTNIEEKARHMSPQE